MLSRIPFFALYSSSETSALMPSSSYSLCAVLTPLPVVPSQAYDPTRLEKMEVEGAADNAGTGCAKDAAVAVGFSVS